MAKGWSLLRSVGKRLFAPVTLPGWAVVLLFLFTEVPAWKDQVTFWSETVVGAMPVLSHVFAFFSYELVKLGALFASIALIAYGALRKEVAKQEKGVDSTTPPLMRDSDPRVTIRFDDKKLPFPATDFFVGERPILLNNRGKSDAHEIKIEDVVLTTGIATFKTVGLIRPEDGDIKIRPELFGPKREKIAPSTHGVHELEILLQAEWMYIEPTVPTFATEMRIRYRDYNRNNFLTELTATYHAGSGLTSVSNIRYSRLD